MERGAVCGTCGGVWCGGGERRLRERVDAKSMCVHCWWVRCSLAVDVVCGELRWLRVMRCRAEQQPSAAGWDVTVTWCMVVSYSRGLRGQLR